MIWEDRMTLSEARGAAGTQGQFLFLHLGLGIAVPAAAGGERAGNKQLWMGPVRGHPLCARDDLSPDSLYS